MGRVARLRAVAADTDVPTKCGHPYCHHSEGLKLGGITNADTVAFTKRGDSDWYHPKDPDPGGITNADTIVVTNCGYLYWHNSEDLELGEITNADEAIDSLSLTGLPITNSSDQSAFLTILDNEYARQSESIGQSADIDKAIDGHNPAVLLTPHDHVDNPSWLHNRGNLHMHQFEHFGELAHIDEAIKYLRRAVLLSPDDHPDRPRALNNLGSSYLNRFEFLGEFTDIEKAIDYHTQATTLTPDRHADMPGYLNDLGNSYLRLFERRGVMLDLEKAIELHSQALSLTPDGRVGKLTIPKNLGVSYLRKFERLGDPADIDEAIRHQRQAVLLTPDSYADKPNQLNNLGISCLSRFMRQGVLADVDEAIDRHHHAVLFTPDGHPDKPRLIYNLGQSYMCRFERLGTLTDGKTARASFQKAAELNVINPAIQFRSARKWARSSTLLGDSPCSAYKRSMELMPQLVWLGLSIDQRYNSLIEIGDVATEAAAWAISVRAYDLAVEWLEEGRSIVWNQILKLRTPFDELAVIDPVLASRLREVATQLEHAGSPPAATSLSTYSPLELENIAQCHHRLAVEWERLLHQARGVPGFSKFMRPYKANELKPVAADGPVIVINCHSSRCDALIISSYSNHIVHVPLESFSLNKAVDASSRLKSLVGCPGDRARGFKRSNLACNPADSFKSILETLWLEVVKPVLDKLGLTVSKLALLPDGSL